MIRTIVTPETNGLHILIPDGYVGRKLEMLLYAMDEPMDVAPDKVHMMSEFRGLLTAEEADKMQVFISKSRAEWD